MLFLKSQSETVMKKINSKRKCAFWALQFQIWVVAKYAFFKVLSEEHRKPPVLKIGKTIVKQSVPIVQ